MTEPPSKDPAAAWRDLVAQWEKNLNELANRAMGSDEFAKSMNQAVNLSAGMQNSMSDAMGRYLASLNLPSRAEMIDFGERLPLAYRPCKDLVELLQGGVHGLANRPDPFQPEPRLDEIRLDPQPFQGIRSRPVEPPRHRSAVGVESGDLGRFLGRALGQEPNEAVAERLVFADQSLDCALASARMRVEGVQGHTRDGLGLGNRIAADAGRTAALNLQPDQWNQDDERLRGFPCGQYD